MLTWKYVLNSSHMQVPQKSNITPDQDSDCSVRCRGWAEKLLSLLQLVRAVPRGVRTGTRLIGAPRITGAQTTRNLSVGRRACPRRPRPEGRAAVFAARLRLPLLYGIRRLRLHTPRSIRCSLSVRNEFSGGADCARCWWTSCGGCVAPCATGKMRP